MKKSSEYSEVVIFVIIGILLVHLTGYNTERLILWISIGIILRVGNILERLPK